MNFESLQQEEDHIKRMLKIFSEQGIEKLLNDTNDKDFRKALLEFECSHSYELLLKALAVVNKTTSFESIIEESRYYLIYKNDSNTCANIFSKAIQDMALSFSEFLDKIFNFLVDDLSPESESTILEKIYPSFLEIKDRVSCLERLSLLYEKRSHNEVKLAETYEKILSLDQNNIKALKFFKTIFTQTQDWKAVESVLLSLVKNPNLKEGERSRIALELASCLLYNLEKPSEALTVLDEYLVESELDSSAIYFDAYFTSKQFDSCFRILRAAEVNAESNEERSILAFKSAKLYLEQGLLSDTISALKKTLELDANFHEAYELIVMSFAQEGDFSGISQYLDQWIKFIHSPNLKSQVNTFKTEFLLQNMQRINSLQNSQ